MSKQDYKTSETLLQSVRNWRDNLAWNEMFQRYDPLLERWSRRYLKNQADVAEVNQRIWIELANRLVLFRYDTGQSFRAWLRTLHQSRVKDFLKSKGREAVRFEKACQEVASSNLMPARELDVSTTGNSTSAQLEHIQNRVMRIQASVKSRVQEKTWQIFWSIAVQERSIRETAKTFGMTYAATFAAFSRVQKLLKDEALKD